MDTVDRSVIGIAAEPNTQLMACVCVQTLMSQVLRPLGDVIPVHTDLSNRKSMLECYSTLPNTPLYTMQYLDLGECLPTT